jgi:hypothetical protein
MAQRAFHGIAHNWFAQLNADVDSDDTTLVLKNSGATNCPAAPFYLVIGTEIVRVSNVEVDTPSAGLDSLAVSRAELGTVGAAHVEDDWIQCMILTVSVTELQERIAAMERLLVHAYGGGEGVFATSESRTQLQVVAQGTPDMTVQVNMGAGIASGMPVSLAANYDTAAIVAPVSNPRIDVVEIGVSEKSGATEINIVTGTEAGSPSAPSVTTGYYKLAEIYCRVGMASIKNTDDATNGYITDRRRIL